MINWLKFRDRAAYYRDGKIALAAATASAPSCCTPRATGSC
jgi:hypothetical protein